MDGCIQLTFKHDADELIAVKRMKKEPGATTGKSVVVLKNSDVTTRNEMVFMPNTIEMAQLKKPEKGQFKTNVQICSKMTEMDIKRILVETFPILECQRFWCAAAVDNRTRLDFHGERRIWDGHSIKRRIKGNSALYIFADPVEEGVDHQDPKVSEQSTLKRSHDQITNPENKTSEQKLSQKDTPEDVPILSSSNHIDHRGSEKQAKIYAAGYSPKNVASYPSVVPSSGALGAAAVTGTVFEKSDYFHHTEGQLLRQKLPDRVAEMKRYVYVTSQHGVITSASHPSSMLANQQARKAKDVTVAALTSSHSMPLGTIMVPGGIVVAQQGVLQKIVTTASEQQSLGKAVFHVAGACPEARHAGLPLVTQTVPQASTLTPQMSNLNISKESSLQLQKTVYVEKCAGKRDQSAQTEEGAGELSSQHYLPVATTAQSDRSFPVEVCEKTATGMKHVAFRSLDQSQLSTDVNTGSSQVGVEGACVNNASDRRHEDVGASASDHEMQSSDPADSGIETGDSLTEDTSQSQKSFLDFAKETRRHENKAAKSDEAEWSASKIEEESGLSLLSGVALNALKIRSALTEVKSIVGEICPKTSPVRGGSIFMIILSKHLPGDVVSGNAYFGSLAPVIVTKINEFNMVGKIPAAPAPGTVTVKVHTSSGHFLGETLFDYIDVVEDVLQMLLHDRKLQARYFFLLAKELRSETEKNQTSEPSGSFKNIGSERTGSIDNLVQQYLVFEQLLEKKGDRSGNCPTSEPSVFRHSRNTENETGYESDDEASSTDSSEEVDIYCNPSGFDPSSKVVETDEINKCDNEQKICLKPEDVAINDSLESLSSNSQESEPIRGRLDCTVSPLNRKETETSSFVSQDKRSEVPERSNMPGNTENMDEQLNLDDLDENSVSDKTRRTHCVTRSNQADGSRTKLFIIGRQGSDHVNGAYPITCKNTTVPGVSRAVRAGIYLGRRATSSRILRGLRAPP